MFIIPAVDILNGKVVRLKRGNFDDVTCYSDDPAGMAKRWKKEGAKLLHTVDLEAARTGKPVSMKIISKIAHSVSIPVQLGGGMRDESAIENAFSSGVSRVVLGTKACQDEDFIKKMVERFGEKILVSIDAKEGWVATDGWEVSAKIKPIELGIRIKEMGIKTIIYTDTTRDGTLTGPNLEELKKFLNAVKIQVIASGGISSLNDILKLKELESDGLCGVILGRALYEGKISLKEAIRKG